MGLEVYNGKYRILGRNYLDLEKRSYVLNVEYGIDLIKFLIIMIYRYLCRNFGGGYRYIFFDRKMMMIIYNI